MSTLSIRPALVAAGVLITAIAATTSTDPRPVTVHEWGTFTSIAGKNGRAVPWQPLGGPADLPGFVRHSGVERKGTLTATVRMETPVLYFYTADEAVVDISVGFRQGLITEYFPRAVVSAGGLRPGGQIAPGVAHRITWTDVRIQPGATPAFPLEPTPNHYYAARATDASPLQVGPDRERFLFYRGVGSFELPLMAVVGADGEVKVTNSGNETIPAVMLFENRRGRIGWRLHRGLTGQVRLASPTAGGDVASMRTELERMLVDEGLFDKEAIAMVDTWSDSWFEEGTRLFYVLPRRAVDSILPLEIRPAATDVVRVFVGRLELVTAASLTDLGDALRTNDRATLARFGRFLRPLADRFLEAPLPPADRVRFESILEAVYSNAGNGPASPGASATTDSHELGLDRVGRNITGEGAAVRGRIFR